MMIGGDGGPTHRGVCLPPTQGKSNSGAFLPGVSEHAYSAEDLATIVGSCEFAAATPGEPAGWAYTPDGTEGCFNSIRLCINPDTARHPQSLSRLRQYFDAAAGARGIICMFGQTQHADDPHGDGHGTGLLDDLPAAAAGWRAVHKVFGGARGVLYELFNEPFGYSDDAKVRPCSPCSPYRRCCPALDASRQKAY
eukprot:SAG22_NODE_3779_length_1532_cov_2.817865_2_plen_195_part_00